MSYNNTAYLSASTGGTEAFIEQSAVAVRSRDVASDGSVTAADRRRRALADVQ
jgi:hypothetical protein